MSSASRTAVRVVLLYAGLILVWGVLLRLPPNSELTELANSPQYVDLVDFLFVILIGLLLLFILRKEFLAQKEIAERARVERDLATLLDFSQEVAATLRIEPLLDLVFNRLADLVGYTSAAIYESQNDSLVMVAYRGLVPPDVAVDGGGNWEGQPFTEIAARQKAPVISVDLASGGSVMLVPLVLHDCIIGGLRLSHEQPGYFGQRQARLAFSIANQAAVAIENARLYEEAQRTGVLRERARLARELHDSIIQEIHALVWKIRAARDMSERGTGSASALLQSAAAHAKASLSDLRALIFDLRPELLEELGLTGLLKQYVDTMREGYPATFSLELGNEPVVELPVKEALYRIAREAMHNAAKHAYANEIVLRLQQDSDQILMEVADDGIGFDSSSSYPGHLGLLNMQQRVLQFDGAVEILSEQQCGTQVVVRVPYHNRSNGH